MTMRSTASSPQRYLRELMRSFLAHLANAQSGDPVATHQLRVYGRRLRVALPLLVRKPDGRRVREARRRLRNVVRAAGASRDRDVMLDLLQEDLDRADAKPETARLLHGRLRDSTRRARQRLAVRIPAQEIYRLRTALRAACARPVVQADALQRIRKQSRRLRKKQLKELKMLGQRFNAERLHALRRRLRRLRYIAETQDRLTARSAGAVETLKSLQTLLGRIRDRWMLAEWFTAQAKSRRQRGQARLRQEARRRARLAVREARRLHRKWLAGNPAQQLESVYWTLSVVRLPGPSSSG